MAALRITAGLWLTMGGLIVAAVPARAAAPVLTEAAHSGSHYGASATTSSGGGIYQDVALSTSAGQLVCGSAWVRSDYPATGASGSFVLWLLGGSRTEGGAAAYSGLSNLGNWTQVHDCVEATTAHTQVRIQFYPTPGGPTVDMDDVDVHESLAVNGGFENGSAGWGVWPNSGSNFAVYQSASSSADPPHSGSFYGATNTTQNGGGIYEDVALNTTAGQVVCGSAWLRTEGAATGASGSFALWLLGGSGAEGMAAPYSGLGNGPSWSEVHSCVEATGSHSTLRIQFYPAPGSPTVEIDDVDVHESLATNGGFENGLGPWSTYPNTNSTYAAVPAHQVLGPVVTAPQPTALPLPPRRSRHALRVRIRFSWTWRYATTRLDRARIGRFPGRARLVVACLGRGCRHRRQSARGPRAIRRLVRRLHGRRFHSGQKLRVTLSAPGWTAERAEIIFRYGRLPLARLLRG